MGGIDLTCTINSGVTNDNVMMVIMPPSMVECMPMPWTPWTPPHWVGVPVPG